MFADKQTLAALLQRTSVGMQPEGIAGIFCGATPYNEAVFLSERKGFVRVAIQAGVGMHFLFLCLVASRAPKILASSEPLSRRTLPLA